MNMLPVWYSALVGRRGVSWACSLKVLSYGKIWMLNTAYVHVCHLFSRCSDYKFHVIWWSIVILSFTLYLTDFYCILLIFTVYFTDFYCSFYWFLGGPGESEDSAGIWSKSKHARQCGLDTTCERFENIFVFCKIIYFCGGQIFMV
jgi:hypothetical protein